MKFLKAIIALVLFTLICVSSAGASGIVKFHIPAISNAAVGDTVDATLYVDNNLNPLSSDIALNLDWNNEVIQYVGTDFSAGHTTSAEPVGSHQLTLNIADSTNGIAAGDVPAAHIKFKVVGPGTSPVVVNINKVTDLSGTDITSKAVASNGAVTATGTASATTTPQTTATVTTSTTSPTTTTSSSTTATTPVQGQIISAGPATVPANTGIFAVSSVGNVAVGQTGIVTLYVDNAWNPHFGDTYVDLYWDASVAQYLSSEVKVSSNTTAIEGGDGHLRVALGDFRNGYPTGIYPIATINLKALKDGTTPLTITIDHVRYWSSDLSTFTDITSSASAVSGVFSTGAIATPTQVVSTVTGNPVTTTTQYIAPSGPVSFGDSSSSSSGDVYTGVGGEPTIKTIPTTVVTTVPTTTVVTPVPTNQTIEEPTITIETTAPPIEVQTIATTVPTTQKSGAGFGMITLLGLTAAGLLFLAARKD
ncbi:hypothetical protein [Methanosphaerula palustris]|uniref:Cellulosome anchoring protein cohesin region n=1 Tax=Methanosphaerula palustris (strain ATCC BAA-1556 / DSM 19958 / E1-9c) TaxID=521011 RepID=B8GIZ4_METPE|nr:hypothetical protein [Methanosphaerula palustris]ACL15567.1 hypothetical protein Mpal_0177 [Methanosphaerula palustris E1-9c]